jgi:opacity protein-like surface antigen
VRVIKRSKSYYRSIAVVLGVFACICLASSLQAQQWQRPSASDEDLAAKPVTEEYHGFTAWEEFRGSTSSQGQFLIFDTSFGYDFNRHIGTDIGVPVYLIRATPTFVAGATPTKHVWDYNVGDPYWDLRLSFPNRLLNYDTVATLSVPVNETGAFSTGRLGVDWFNHFDRPIGPFTPYVNAGIGNGLLDTRMLSQPYRLYDSFRSLGFIADAEGGATVRLMRGLSIGGSYYELFPSGSQKLYSANGITNFFLLPNGVSPAAVSDLTHDRGYTAFVRFTHGNFYFEPAYVHSIKLNDDAATLTIGVDVGSLLTHRHSSH